MSEVSTKPYLIRAIYEWCTDSGYRPFIAVVVDSRTQVPREFVRNGEIVLNIAAAATNRLQIGNELLEFEARFGGVARHVSIPIDNVRAIFAQENGHGMAFEAPAHADGGADTEATDHVVAEPVAPADDEAPADPSAVDAGAGRAPAKRTAAKRARKTVLREVGTKAPGGEATGEGEAPKAGSTSARRHRKPSIAAVPRKADPGAGDKARERSRGPDDDPGPGTTPGKPHLTRVK